MLCIAITFSATGAFRREHSMVVVDAVDLIVNVYCERDSVETLVADTATETTRVVRLAHRLKDLKGQNICLAKSANL